MNEQVKEQTEDLDSWFEKERTLLYDYLVRMTSDMGRSQSSTLEVMQVVRSSFRSTTEDRERRCLLYRTARSFNADCWFRSPDTLLDSLYLGSSHHRWLRGLEDNLNQLPSHDREITLLRYRYGFVSTEIAGIVNRSVSQVQESINQSVLQLRQSQKNVDMAQLKLLPNVPFIEFETSTLAIDEIVDKISRPWQTHFWRTMICLILLVFAAFLSFENWPISWPKPWDVRAWLEFLAER